MGRQSAITRLGPIVCHAAYAEAMSNDGIGGIYGSFDELVRRHSSMARAPRPCAYGAFTKCDVEVAPGVDSVKRGGDWFCSEEHAALEWPDLTS